LELLNRDLIATFDTLIGSRIADEAYYKFLDPNTDLGLPSYSVMACGNTGRPMIRATMNDEHTSATSA